MDQETQQWKQELVAATAAVPAPIRDDTTAGQVSEKLAVVTKVRKAFEAKLKALVAPMKEAIEGIKAEFDPFIGDAKAQEDVYKTALQEYRQWGKDEAARQQMILDKQHAEVVKEQEARGVPVNLQTPAPVVEGPARGFATASGTVSARRVPKWKVVKEALLPEAILWQGKEQPLWVLNETLIGEIRRAYGENPSPIPGVEFFYAETLGVR